MNCFFRSNRVNYDVTAPSFQCHLPFSTGKVRRGAEISHFIPCINTFINFMLFLSSTASDDTILDSVYADEISSKTSEIVNKWKLLRVTVNMLFTLSDDRWYSI